MVDKRGSVRRNRGLFNSNTRPSHTKINYKKYIFSQPNTDELYRRCGKKSETIQHITAACQQLARIKYVKRQASLPKVIHQKLAEAAKSIEDKSLYYKNTPANVLETDHFKLY